LLRIYLIVASIFLGLTLPIGVVALFQAGDLMVNSNSQNKLFLQTAFCSIVSYPFAVMMALFASWWAYKKGEAAKLIVAYTLMPFLNILVLFVIASFAK
jgi:hypothetical protein